MLYRTAVEDVPLGDVEIPLGQARTVRRGSDVTLVGWGQQVLVLELAARALEEADGISAEVIGGSLVGWKGPPGAAGAEAPGRLSSRAPSACGPGHTETGLACSQTTTPQTCARCCPGTRPRWRRR